jgi:hypothetical protein
MKSIFKYFVLSIFTLFLSNCESEDTLRDEILNDSTKVPFVMLQDQNETPFTGTGSTWNKRLRGENGRTQVRIKFYCSDPNITSHDIVVHRTRNAMLMNFDDPNSADAPKVIRSLPMAFPTEDVIITRQQIADLYGVPITSLPATIFFSGVSRSSNGTFINGKTRFETYTAGSEVRHAYRYEWRAADGN